MTDNNNKSTIAFHISGLTAADVASQITDLAKTLGSDPIATARTEDLLAELRDRLAKNGQVVKVVPFADTEIETATAPATTTTTTTRKPRTTKEKAAAPEKTETAPVTEPAKTEPETQTETTADAPAKTVEDVKLALNAFSAVKGQVEARKIMQETGGAMRLMDIPADKFPALIAALAVPAANQMAA